MKFDLIRVTGTNTQTPTEYTTDTRGYLIAENLRAGRYILHEHATTIYEPLGDVYFRLEYNADGTAKVTLTKSDFLTPETYDYVNTGEIIGEGDDAQSFTKITNTRKKTQVVVTKNWLNGPQIIRLCISSYGAPGNRMSMAVPLN